MTIHPLFLAAGILSAIVGSLPVFLTATVAAIEHECAHAFAARRLGYTLNRVVLMPYGAVVKGEIAGLTSKQEIYVAAAGPFINAVTGLFFIALWWLYPETYPYTDTAAICSFSLFFVNLLPAMPLDGGRVLSALLRPLGEKKQRRICLIATLVTAAGILMYFILTFEKRHAFSALFFGVFLLVGSIGGESYQRISFSRKKSFSRGVEERRIAIDADRTVGYALRFLRADRYTTFLLFEEENFFGELSEEEFLHSVEEGDWEKTLKEISPNLI